MLKENATYSIKLPQFEGPFDLLLFFIERDELDIYNIPIAQITSDFLDYLHKLEALDIDLASEFVVVAASLMRIKAKMLLPRKEVNELGNEIDPREELVQRLLEYKKYKSIIDEMRRMELQRSEQEARGNVSAELHQISNKALADAELESLTLFKLLQAFQKVMERFQERNIVTVHQVVQYNYTIEEQKLNIKQLIAKGRTHFERIFEGCQSRIHALFNFLALLELVQLQEIDIIIGEGINNFWLQTITEEE